MRFRIGVHLGDVMIRDGDLYGDAVNIAARLEALAEPGGVCVSAAVREHAGTRVPATFADIGLRQVKNIAEPIHIYRVSSPAAIAARQAVDRGFAVHEHVERPRAGISRRRHCRGRHHRAVAFSVAVVIARNSSYTYKGRAIDVKQIGRELGVR